MDRRQFLKKGALWLPGALAVNPICARIARAVGSQMLLLPIGSVADWTDVTMFISFEGTWSGGTYTHAAGDYGTDTTGTGVDAVDINGVIKKVGSNSLKVTGGTDSLTFNGNDFSSTEGGIAFWWYPQTWYDGGQLVDIRYDASNDLLIEMDGTDELRFKFEDAVNGNQWIITTTLSLTVLNWYVIEAYWKISTNQMRLIVSTDTSRGDLLDTTETDEALQAWTAEPGTNDVRIGHPNSGTGAYRIDNFFMTSSYDKNLWALRNETAKP